MTYFIESILALARIIQWGEGEYRDALVESLARVVARLQPSHSRYMFSQSRAQGIVCFLTFVDLHCHSFASSILEWQTRYFRRDCIEE
jgi:hypothetical protein